MPLSTCFTERGPEAIQMHTYDLPENIRSLKISPVNILSRLGATKSPRRPQNSQHETLRLMLNMLHQSLSDHYITKHSSDSCEIIFYDDAVKEVLN